MPEPIGRAEALARIPQQEPFRFVDEILELDAEHAVGVYRWPEDAAFYRGHFPGDPVTPGVLLVECMAQCTLVPLALYLLARDDPAAAEKALPLFTDADVEFSGVVRPGEQVRTEAQVTFWRRRKLRVAARMLASDGSIVCSGAIAGMGIAR